MSRARSNARQLIAAIISALQDMGELGEQWTDANGGWTGSSRDVWIRYFRELDAKLASGSREFEHDAFHLIRELDHHGVVGGEVRRRAADLQALLKSLLPQAPTAERKG